MPELSTHRLATDSGSMTPPPTTGYRLSFTIAKPVVAQRPDILGVPARWENGHPHIKLPQVERNPADTEAEFRTIIHQQLAQPFYSLGAGSFEIVAFSPAYLVQIPPGEKINQIDVIYAHIRLSTDTHLGRNDMQKWYKGRAFIPLAQSYRRKDYEMVFDLFELL